MYNIYLLTIVSCHFLTLISIKIAPVLSTSGDNFQEENGKKIGQSDFCWKYISSYVTFPWSYSLP